jgi:flavorubredoxin
MTRINDVHWIENCVTVEEGTHMHVSEYLIESDNQSILIDSGSDHHRKTIINEINALTDRQGPDVILLTHSTLPHTENVNEFESEWNPSQVITASSVPSIIGLPDANPWQPGKTIKLAGRTISFIDPLLTDVVLSQWIYDHDSRVLFTSEAIGNYHQPSQCDVIPDQHNGEFESLTVSQYYRDKLPFMWYVEPDQLRSAFEDLFEKLDVEYIAPIHGNPIHRSLFDPYLDRLCQCAAEMTFETHA